MPQYLSTDDIRSRWISFFKAQGHKHIASDLLVPQNDPSVLFTGAGMNQFKDHFMGRAKIDHPQQRAVTVQKCIRTGDIDNVGRTPSHHTMFEMLGNFSFGDYFKKEAITWAWTFTTDPVVGVGIEKERLSVTIYGGNPALGIAPDEDAEKFWQQTAPELQNKDGSWRIYKYGDKDNFWPANAPGEGPNGPCGPCTEMYYDTKPEQGAPEPVADSKDPFRYIEIGNKVFTQFNRVGVGKLEALGRQNIDVGDGLERLARVIQGKSSNFEIDLLFPIVEKVARIAGKKYESATEDGRRMRRITDHTRAAVFCIADGVAPKNEGRNYVVRRLMRRAILDGRELGITDAFLGKVARVVIKQMSVGYPEIGAPRDAAILRAIEDEEKSFSKTLEDGRNKLESVLLGTWLLYIKNNPNSELATLSMKAVLALNRNALRVELLPSGDVYFSMRGPVSSVRDDADLTKLSGWHEIEAEWHSIKQNLSKYIPELPGSIAFTMWDTFGFPIELTEEIVSAYGISVDKKGYQNSLQEAAKRSQAGSTMSKEIFESGPVAELKKTFAGKGTIFKGYDALNIPSAKVLAIVQNNELKNEAAPGDAVVMLDQTPFYGESGGQVGDRGALVADGVRHDVLDTQKQEGLFFHRVKLNGVLKIGASVGAEVDPAFRNPLLKNHSATHLLHNALRGVLGTHVEQRGSLVSSERLRFDFTHFEQIKPEQLAEIEARVNALVASDFKVDTQELPIAEAKAKGAMALFGEKYGDRVRVVQMGPSVELCGGTHCATTGQIGYCRIVSESSVAAGVRRIEALTGSAAVADARKTDDQLSQLALMLKVRRDAVQERFVALQDENAALGRELESLRKKAANAAAGELLSQVVDVNGAKLLAARVDGADTNGLRSTLDGIRKQMPECAVVLGGTKDGKVALLVSFPETLVKRGAHAGNLLKELAPKVGGKGGGKPDMAQGGGSDESKLNDALAAVKELFDKMLK